MFKDTKEGETQHNDMTTLQEEIEAFEKKFADTIDDVVWFGDNPLIDEIKSFLRQSLLRFARAVIEEAMPNKIDYATHMKSKRAFDEGNGWNDYRIQFKENIERILAEK